MLHTIQEAGTSKILGDLDLIVDVIHVLGRKDLQNTYDSNPFV